MSVEPRQRSPCMLAPDYGVYETPGGGTQLDDDLLTGRSTALTFDNRMDTTRHIETGIPQGSPASPILFLLYVQPLFVELDGIHGLWTPSFIDDIALVVQGRRAVRNASRLEEAAKIAFEWADNHCVAFGDSKTELIHFHRKCTPKNRPPDTARLALERVTLPNGTIVSQPADNEGIRWLGIWFDRRLNFKYYVR
jgi:hypothetical protein